jgi:putative nucleotidyltransferase with HDIG domain
LGIGVSQDLGFQTEVDEFFSLLTPQQFMDGLNLGLTFQDAEGIVVGCNRKGAALLGRPREQILGRPLADLPWINEPFDFSALAGQRFVNNLDARSATTTTSRQLGINGPAHSVRWLALSSFPVVVEGVRKGSMISYRDVTIEHQREQSLELMTEINRLMILSNSEDDFLKSVCDAFVRVGGFTLARIDVAVDDDAHSIRSLCFAGPYGYVANAAITWSDEDPSGAGPIGRALKSNIAVQVDDLLQDPSMEPWYTLLKQFSLRSCVSIPLTLPHSRAVLTAYASNTYAFPGRKFQRLQAMVHEVEFAVAHVSAVADTETALNGTIAALSQMTETRDPYTSGHQFSVGSLSEAIARRMGLDSVLCKLIRQSGELHDVGKIAIPVEILTRPGAISKLEFDLIKTHPVVGADILAKAHLPWPIVDVALQHHERMDGSGYPFGLKGEDVIMPARIVAVADVVEAMSQRRPYRPALGRERALAEILRGSGTLYDPDVVTTCLEVFTDGFEFDATASSADS